MIDSDKAAKPADVEPGGTILSAEEHREWMIDRTIKKLITPVIGSLLALIVGGGAFMMSQVDNMVTQKVGEQIDNAVTVAFADTPELTDRVTDAVSQALADEEQASRITKALLGPLSGEGYFEVLAENAMNRLKDADDSVEIEQRLVLVRQVIGFSEDPSAPLRQFEYDPKASGSALNDEPVVQEILPVLEFQTADLVAEGIVEDLLQRARLVSEDHLDAYGVFLAKLPDALANQAVNWIADQNWGTPADARKGAVLVTGLACGGRLPTLTEMISWTREEQPIGLQTLGWTGLGVAGGQNAQTVGPVACQLRTSGEADGLRRIQLRRMLQATGRALHGETDLPAAVRASQAAGLANASGRDSFRAALMAGDYARLDEICFNSNPSKLCDFLYSEDDTLAIAQAVLELAAPQSVAGAGLSELGSSNGATTETTAWYAARLTALMSTTVGSDGQTDWDAEIMPFLTQTRNDHLNPTIREAVVLAWGLRIARNRNTDLSPVDAEGLADSALTALLEDGIGGAQLAKDTSWLSILMANASGERAAAVLRAVVTEANAKTLTQREERRLLAAALRAGGQSGNAGPVIDTIGSLAQAGLIRGENGAVDAQSVRLAVARVVVDALGGDATGENQALNSAFRLIADGLTARQDDYVRAAALTANLLLDMAPEDDMLTLPAVAQSNLYTATQRTRGFGSLFGAEAHMNALSTRVSDLLPGIEALSARTQSCQTSLPSDIRGDVVFCRVGTSEGVQPLRLAPYAQLLGVFGASGAYVNDGDLRDRTLTPAPDWDLEQRFLLVQIAPELTSRVPILDEIITVAVDSTSQNGADMVMVPDTRVYTVAVTPEQPAVFSFTPPADANYLVRAYDLQGGVDTFITVSDSDGNELASDDDGGSGLASRLNLSEPVGKPLSVEISTISQAGSFTADVLTTIAKSLTPGSAEPVSFDGEGELTYSFRVEPGTRYALETSRLAQGVDTTITVTWPDGGEPAYNDDGATGLASALERSYLGTAGRAFVTLGNIGSPGTAEFILRAEPFEVESLTPGTSHRLDMGEDASALFSFEASPFTQYRLETTQLGAGMDTDMTISWPDGETEDYDDDGGDNLASLVETTYLGRGGIASVTVNNIGSAGTGQLELTTTPVRALSIDTPMVTELGDYSEEVYQIGVDRAGQYRFTTSDLATNIDTEIAVLDGAGAELGRNDDGGAGLASQLELALDAGTYFVVLRNIGSGEGEVTTSVTALDAP